MERKKLIQTNYEGIMKRSALLSLLLILALTTSLTDAQEKNNKVYWMVTTTVPLAKIPEYHRFAEKELFPAQEKYGYTIVAGWQTIIGEIEEVIVVAEFDDMNAYMQARRNLLRSPEWKAMGPAMDALTRSTTTRMMTALPFVSMK